MSSTIKVFVRRILGGPSTGGCYWSSWVEEPIWSYQHVIVNHNGHARMMTRWGLGENMQIRLEGCAISDLPPDWSEPFGPDGKPRGRRPEGPVELPPKDSEF